MPDSTTTPATPATKTIVTKQWALQVRDWVIGGVLAGVTAGVTALITMLNSPSHAVDLKAAGGAALGALIAYLGKNFVEPGATITITPTKQQ